MSYIGSSPTTAAFPFDQFSGTGSQTAFTLSQAPASATSIAVTVSGVTQNPNTYSVSGTTLTFTGAPPLGTNNIGVLFLGLPTLIGVPGAATVGLTQLSATGTPSSSTFLRGDNTWNAPAAAITSGTAVTASGTSVNFNSIPSTAKRITVMFSGVSTNGTSNYLVQIGSGSVTSSGYISSASYATNVVLSVVSTAGFVATSTNTAANVTSGNVVLCLIANNTWVSSGVLTLYTFTGTQFNSGNSPALAGVLDRVRITTVNGTDTFDAGTINIMWE